jgi:hypothetical protein
VEQIMEIETLKEVIHWVKKVHLQLSQCLLDRQEDSVDEREQLVLSYLTDYESKLAKIVATFEEEGNQNALNTWCIEYITKFKLENGELDNKPFADLTTEQIVAVVVEKHQYLLSLLRYLSMQTVIPETKELMDELSSFEEHETMKMVQSLNRFEDV